VPGLPTTPFLLLTAGLYIRSSEKLYHKLLNNRITGKFITDYRSAKGLTVRQKIYSICLMWLMILISCIFQFDSTNFRLIVIAAGITGTTIMIFFLPTGKKEK
jgi:uncharacterized membrane protein YbaN (DUF454 family)